jgi:type II secretory pathway pseudopilin PulG
LIKRFNSSGFTLLEVLIAAFLGVIIIGFVFSMMVSVERSERSKYATEMRELRKASAREYMRQYIQSGIKTVDGRHGSDCVYQIINSRLRVISRDGSSLLRLDLGLVNSSGLGTVVAQSPDGASWQIVRTELFDPEISRVSFQLHSDNCIVRAVTVSLDLVDGDPDTYIFVVAI